MSEIANDIAWEARDLAYDAVAAVAKLEQRLLTIETAFKTYVREAPNGPFAARETALDILNGG